MNWDSVISVIQIAVAYFFLCTIMPAICLHYIVKGRSLVYQFIFYNILSNLYIIMIVFILAYLNIFNKLMLIVTMLLLPIFTCMLVRRKYLMKVFKCEVNEISQLFTGVYGVRLYIKTKWNYLKNYCKYIFKRIVGGKKPEWIIFLSIIGFVIWFYGYYKFNYYQYGHTDEETHLYWIQSLIGGNIFPAGMYPHGLHNIVAAISVLFNITAARATLNFSVISTVMIMTMIYLVFRKLLNSKYAVLIGFTYFIINNIFNYYSYMRFQYFLPMEYGIIALMAALLFLYLYIQSKEFIDLFMFTASIAVTFAIHFYITIFAVVMCAVIGITYIIPIFKNRLFLKLVIGGFIGVLFSTLPFIVGYFMGYEFERSIAWGVSMMSTSADNSEEESESEDTESESTKTEEAVSSSDKEAVFIANFKSAINYLFNESNSFYVLAFLEALLFVYGLLGVLFSKKKEQYLIYVSLALLWLVTFFIYLCYYIGLPVIIEMRRALIFISIFSIPLYVIPFEILHKVLTILKASNKPINLILIILLIVIVELTKFKDYRCYWTTQTDEAMKLSLDLIENYEDHTWTLISPVNELSVIKNNGYHYESLDFAEEIFDWDEELVITIPTKYVFFVIEKYPLKYFQRNINGSDKFEYLNKVDKSYALSELPDVDSSSKSKLYYTNRDTIMSRIYYWAQTYERYYPNEMSVYYEDKMVIVYKLEQNPYALNNLAIDFGLNSNSVQENE